MLDRYRDRFVSLSPEAVSLVWQKVTSRRGWQQPPLATATPADGVSLHNILMLAGVCHAEVVMALARETGELAEVTIAALIGHPIVRRVPGVEVIEVQQPRPQRNRTQRSDPRKIHLRVEGCPKKPGTAAWNLWHLYQEGMTVDEYMAAGGTRAAVRYDSDHGYIELRM